MSDLRGRHGRNFNGTFMNIEGNDATLNDMLDELAYVAGAEVLSRRDTEQGNGVLAIKISAYARPKIVELARKHGLKVAG